MSKADFPNEHVQSDLEKLNFPAPVQIQSLKVKNCGGVYQLEEIAAYVQS